MKTARIINATKNVVIAENAYIADSLWPRMKGLLGKTGLSSQEALILDPCSSIHTFFMRFSIDVIFINRKYQVVRLLENIPPGRVSPFVFSSIQAIELPAGKISKTNTCSGDTLEIRG